MIELGFFLKDFGSLWRFSIVLCSSSSPVLHDLEGLGEREGGIGKKKNIRHEDCREMKVMIALM